MSDPVFHFTDTVRLPWIIETGELRPSKNRIGGYPVDFLWATTSAVGDRTSAAQLARHQYREGIMQLIRFTLPGDAFTGWRETVNLYPEWTSDHISRLEGAARKSGETGMNNWRVRASPLPLSAALSVEAKLYSVGRWVPITASSEFCISFKNDPQGRGFVIGEQAYCATRTDGPTGQTSYSNLARMGVTPS